MAEDYQERIDRRAAEYEKIRQKAFRDGFDAAKEQAAHYIENQTAGAIDPLWSGSVAAEGIRALKPDWLDANRPKKNA